jgi:POT family proton-dependent oligopeptide transporter
MLVQCSSVRASACRYVSVTRLQRLLSYHPRGFYLLCLAVLCERWAAAILSSSVVLMLCERYGYGRSDALRLAGLYSAASYLLTLPGGFALDRLLGAQRALGMGMVLLLLGYAALTLSPVAALWLPVPLLLLGHALFKPSTQAVMVFLYERHDPRLEAAQIICYLGVNAAASAGAVCAGLLVRGHSFRTAFSLAAVILLIGCMVLAFGKHAFRLRPRISAPLPPSASAPIEMSAQRRAKIIAALTLAMMLFTVGFGQVEGALFLWAQDRTDRRLCGFEIPASWFVGLPAFLVLLLAPAQLALLPRLRQRLSTPQLIVLGLVAVMLAFAVLIPPALLSNGHRVSMLWLLACMTLLVIGELLIAPLGLSLLIRLAPPRLVGVVMGIWYVAGAVGCWLAGEVGALWMK